MSRRSRRADDAIAAVQATYDDARQLAVELATGRPYWPIDVMHIGLVLEPGETAFRYFPATISQFDPTSRRWPPPTACWVLMTNERAIVRTATGQVISLPWRGITALDPNLQSCHVTLDYGDGEPRCLSGPTSVHIAVAAIAGVYGIDGLLRHSAIASLRQPESLHAFRK